MLRVAGAVGATLLALVALYALGIFVGVVWFR